MERPRHRFYVHPDQIKGDLVILKDGQAHQIVQVLRRSLGDCIVVFEGSGLEYEVEIIRMSPGEVMGRILDRRNGMAEPSFPITLAQSLPKGNKMDLIVQKATELGASQIIALATERTIPGQRGRVLRWQRIAVEAAEQCGRTKVPQVEGPLPLQAFLEDQSIRGVQILLWEGEADLKLRDILRGHPFPEKLTLIVGPEGGFTAKEVDEAQKKGYRIVSLGPRVLRTETAALVALSIVQYELGDLG